MNAKLLVGLLIVVVLIVAALGVVLTLEEVGSAKIINQPPLGMGDLHRFEAEGFIPGTYTQEKPNTYNGMGDLQRLEFLQETQFPD